MAQKTETIIQRSGIVPGIDILRPVILGRTFLGRSSQLYTGNGWKWQVFSFKRPHFEIFREHSVDFKPLLANV